MRIARTRRRSVALVTGLVTVVGVGLAGSAFAGTGPESGSVASDAHSEAAVPGTPCSTSTRACVDLESQRAWLIKDGAVDYGPVPIASGGAGKETPLGHSFRVYRKNADHKSGEYKTPDGRPAPMPWAVFFADGGVAFHGGDRERSSGGCVKLDPEPAQTFFNRLTEGDKVQVVNAAAEQQARTG